jgi:pilus assembly protein Flp/PilA
LAPPETWTEEETPMLTATFRRLIACRSGATAIEYGLIVGLIFLVIVASVTLLSTDMSNMYNTVSNAVTGNM